MWAYHRVELLADFRQVFGLHPWDPALSVEEADDLTTAIVEDSRSRVFAAMVGWHAPLEALAWSGVCQFLGVDLKARPKERRPDIDPSLRRRAADDLAARSAIPDHLPVV